MSPRKRKLIGSLIVVAALAGVGLSFFIGPNDPKVRGKRISVWITEFNIYGPQPTPPLDAMIEAGHQSEGLLQNMLRARDSSWKLKIKFWLARQKILKLRFRTAAEIQTQALGMSSLLCEEVEGVTPALVGLVNDYPARMKDRATRDYALRTLAVMGTNGINALTGMLQHPDALVRNESARLLGTAPLSGTDEVVKALQGCTRNGDGELKAAAARSLKFIAERQTQHLNVGANEMTTGAPGSIESAVNWWSVKQGVKVTKHSGLAGGFQGVETFEGQAATLEPNSLIFQDSQGDGFTHFIEWTTPQPVTIRSFGLLASHEGSNANFQRAFREFRLSRWDETRGEFTPFHEEFVTVPYGGGYYGATISAFRNLAAPVVAQRFRLEVVQHGNHASPGPKLIELYGFDQPASETLARYVVRNQMEPYHGMKPSVAILVKK